MRSKYFSLIIQSITLAVFPYPLNAGTPQSPAEFEQEFRWVNVKDCVRPPIIPPKPIWINPLDDLGRSNKKIYIRRWLDADGDGICELYDVEEIEKSHFTGKLYGYPRRVSIYEKGKWNIHTGRLEGWLPLILLDRITGARLNVSYSYGNAGYTTGATGPRPDCESLRWTLAEGYMLFFNFPKFAKDDPVMDPKGIWNDYMSAYVNSQYPGKDNFLASPVSSDCKEKYRLVIDALAKELEQ
jgi:hypothetical protein